jgi:hypothetical protein
MEILEADQTVQHALLVKKLYFNSIINKKIAVGLIDQMAQIQNKTISEIFEQICLIFPIALQPECDELVSQYGPLIIIMLGTINK